MTPGRVESTPGARSPKPIGGGAPSSPGRGLQLIGRGSHRSPISVSILSENVFRATCRRRVARHVGTGPSGADTRGQLCQEAGLWPWALPRGRRGLGPRAVRCRLLWQCIATALAPGVGAVRQPCGRWGAELEDGEPPHPGGSSGSRSCQAGGPQWAGTVSILSRGQASRS